MTPAEARQNLLRRIVVVTMLGNPDTPGLLDNLALALRQELDQVDLALRQQLIRAVLTEFFKNSPYKEDVIQSALNQSGVTQSTLTAAQGTLDSQSPSLSTLTSSLKEGVLGEKTLTSDSSTAVLPTDPVASLVGALTPDRRRPPSPTTVSPERRDEVQDIFAFWKIAMGYPKAKLTAGAKESRFSKIHARLEDGFTVPELKQVIYWVSDQPFYRGENDRGKPYDDFKYIFRNRERVEEYLNRARKGLTSREAQNQQLGPSDAPPRERRL